VLDKLKLNPVPLTDLTALTSFKDIEAEVINSTVVIYIHYGTPDEANRAFKIISKYVERVKEVVGSE